MASRISERDLERYCENLAEYTGIDLTIGGAYGRTYVHRDGGGRTLTQGTKRECYDWLSAFAEGWELCERKHKVGGHADE